MPFPSPGDLPNPGIEPGSPSLRADALLSEPDTMIRKGQLNPNYDAESTGQAAVFAISKNPDYIKLSTLDPSQIQKHGNELPQLHSNR